MSTAIKKSLYDPQVYQACLARIGQLTPETQPEWGIMSVGQMLAHCAEIVDVSNGKALQNTPLLATLLKGVIRKMVVGRKRYPKNTRTHPQYKQTTERDFEAEKARLLAALQLFVDDKGTPRKHPLFGVLSVEEKGWSMYKHLDHHLTQFGV